MAHINNESIYNLEENMETKESTAKIQSKNDFTRSLIEDSEGKFHQVMWFEGTAPKQHNDQPVSISGTISAPSQFLTSREGEFYPKTSHALVSKTEGRIVLTINEQKVDEKYQIIGQIQIGKKFRDLGINNFEKGVSPTDLAKFLRLRRNIFEKPTDHINILAKLNNLETKVDEELKASKDDAGNKSLSHSQVVHTNIPKSFRLNIPLIEGADPTYVEVAVVLEANNGRITCFLESVEAADIIEQQFTKLVEKEVDIIKDKTTIIYE